MRRILCLLSLLAGALGAASGQSPSLRFWRITSNDGLPHSFVNDVIQDRNGLMWFGTVDGITSYDGYRFDRYAHDPDNPNSLSYGPVTALVEGDDDVLWVVTSGGGLNRFDRATTTFRRFPHTDDDPQSLTSNDVTSLYRTPDGSLWIGTLDGLNRFDPETESFEAFTADPDDPNSLPENQIASITGAPDESLWIGTYSSGIVHFSPETGRSTTYRHDPGDPGSLASDLITTIYVDPEGPVWVGTFARGLDRLDPETGRFTHFRFDPDDPRSLSDDRILTVFRDRTGTLWVGTDNGGLNQLHEPSGSFDLFKHDPNDPFSLSNNVVTRLFEDRLGVLWVATRGGGLNTTDRTITPVTRYYHDPENPNSLPGNWVRSVVEDRDGLLWVGTTSGLARIDRSAAPGGRPRFTHFRFDPDDPSSLASNSIWALLEDRAGTIWMGTNGGGLHRYEPRTGGFTRFPADPADPDLGSTDWIRCLYEDSAGRLWVGKLDGLYLFDRATGAWTPYRHDPNDPNSLSSTSVRTIREGRDGRLWVGTFDAGLNRFDPATGRAVRFRHDPNDPNSLSNDNVATVYVDTLTTGAAEVLWIGTGYLEQGGGGLNRLALSQTPDGRPEAAFTRYTEQNSDLPDNVVPGILADGRGFLWLSTGRGLSKFDPRTGSFSNYDVDRGLQAKEFTRGAYYRSADGELFFGGINGLNAFYPDQIQDDTRPPTAALTAVYVFGEALQPGPDSPLREPLYRAAEVRLPHDRNSVAFSFSALQYSYPSGNQYRFRLDPIETDWRRPNGAPRAEYPYLSPGTYTFRVRASNRDGLWSEEETSLRLVITPPWWLSRWAYLGYGLLFLGGLFGIDRYRQARVVRIEREKAQIREAELSAESAQLRARAAEALADAWQAEVERGALEAELSRQKESEQQERQFRKRLESEIEEKTREVRRRNRELEETLHQLQSTQAQLIQSEKMASLGQLTAGIAHEINNPINFVSANISPLKLDFEDLRRLIHTYQTLHDAPDLDAALDDARALGDEIDAEFLFKEIRNLLHGIEEGASRTRDIVLGLRTFSRLDEDTFKRVDLHDGINSTLILLNNSIKNRITVHKDYGELPPVECLSGKINQVFMNLLTNAVQAIDGEGALFIKTWAEGDHAFISIRDTGKGMTEAVRNRIFEPFFTTKDVGRGTGLGLSITFSIIRKHGGQIDVESEPGHGSTFTLSLPIVQPESVTSEG